MKLRMGLVLLGLVCTGVAANVPPPSPPPAAPVENGMRTLTVACPVCAHSKEGRGKLRLVPPDYGQHKGAMNAKSYYDVKCTCPICNGRGRLQVYRTVTPTMPEIPPCRTCGWSGVEKCRACKASGLGRCPNRECKNGWIVRRNEVGSGKNNRHYKMSVEACSVCQGVGKVICPDCQGKRGMPCRACSGMGKKVR